MLATISAGDEAISCVTLLHRLYYLGHASCYQDASMGAIGYIQPHQAIVPAMHVCPPFTIHQRQWSLYIQHQSTVYRDSFKLIHL